jgi:hypothetical protein
VQLVAVNKNLVAYHDAWHKMIDSWVIIQVRDPVWVYTWRQQAEAAMRADGRSGMTDEQVGTHILSIKCSIRSKMEVWFFNNPNGQIHTCHSQWSFFIWLTNTHTSLVCKIPGCRFCVNLYACLQCLLASSLQKGSSWC